MKICMLALTLAIVMNVWTVCAKEEFVQSTVTFRVLDEAGAPVTNAIVSYNSYTLARMVDGITDTNGVFIYTDRVAGAISCRVFKDGYYETHGEIWGGPHKWTDHPMNTLTVTLKKIVAPSPLVFRQIEVLFIPELTVPVAFDFAVGDWVAPYGSGKCADVWLTAENRKTSSRDYDTKVTITFSNALDGIQDFMALRPEGVYVTSDLMPPQEAPASGYTNSIVVFNSMRPGTPGATSWVANRNHIFRVRTRTNEANEVVAENVGWTVEDIRVGVGTNGKVGPMFSYYYNPDPKSISLEPIDADKSRRSKKP